jgi:hypothetical protein
MESVNRRLRYHARHRVRAQCFGLLRLEPIATEASLLYMIIVNMLTEFTIGDC